MLLANASNTTTSNGPINDLTIGYFPFPTSDVPSFIKPFVSCDNHYTVVVYAYQPNTNSNTNSNTNCYLPSAHPPAMLRNVGVQSEIWKDLEVAWRSRYMEALSVLLVLCEGHTPITAGLPSQRASVVEPWYLFCFFLARTGWIDSQFWTKVNKSVNWARISSASGLSPGRRQAIIWNNAGLLSIGALWTCLNEVWIILSSCCFCCLYYYCYCCYYHYYYYYRLHSHIIMIIIILSFLILSLL